MEVRASAFAALSSPTFQPELLMHYIKAGGMRVKIIKRSDVAKLQEYKAPDGDN